MNASTNEKAAGAGKLLRGATRGLIWSVIIAAVLLVLFSLFCYMMPDPDQYLSALGLAALYISALVGGIAAGKRSGIVGGLVSGLLLTAVLLIASNFKEAGTEAFSPVITALLYFLVPIAGGAGGLLASFFGNGRKRKKIHAPKKRKR
mgnify:CR=1 FL=1